MLKYLLLLIVLFSGCGFSVKENDMTISNIRSARDGGRFLYGIKCNFESGNKADNQILYFISDKEFCIGDKVELTISKEN